MSRSINIVNTTFAALILSIVGLLVVPNTSHALSGADWNAGRIISDDTFFKSSSMSSSDIQYFLNSMVPNCDTQGTQPYNGTTAAAYGTSRGYPPPYTCLKDYVENPTTHQNNANGGSVSGGASAADIIKFASDTYGISPKVLIVLLQKEQSLVTDSWPWTIQYRSATGYGCPDTAPCDAEYYGFYNQVMKAAYQFKRYAQYPGEYRYKAFQSNFIQWNPNAACGGSDVYIHTQSTAGLYNYTPYQPNATALSNIYGGQNDGCSSYGNRNFWRMYSDWFGSTLYEETFVSYKSHVGGVGWTGSTTNSGTTGTTGQSKSLEAIKINGSVDYSTYNYTTGWQPTVNNGMISGTTGMGRAIQAIKINPTGSLASRYDVYYRAHVGGIGWIGWAKNGETAGITGSSTNNIESIEVRLVLKGYSAPGSTSGAYQNLGTATYNPSASLSVASHIGGFGWQPSVTDTMASGTTEQNKQIEAIKVNLNNTTGQTGGIAYSAFLLGIGWQNWQSNDSVAGTTGQSRRMEALRITLTGQIADSYDVWYRGYVQNIGWLDWTKNGGAVGSVGAGLQLEAIETRITPKNNPPTTLALQKPLHNPLGLSTPDTYSVVYSTHLSDIGWVGNTKQNEVGGTTGQSRPMEAVRFDTINSVFGSLSVSCSAYAKGSGWVNNVSPGNTCGTTGQSKPIESIKLSLSGDAANKYDVYYKVHISTIGWQDWVKNGEQAGTPASNKNIEAIVVKLVQK